MKKVVLYIALILLIGIGACSKKSSVGTGLFQIVNASAGFGPVDVYVDGSKFFSSLTYPGASGYLPLPEGSHSMNFPNAGTTTSLFDVNLSTAANINQTLIIYGRPSSLQVFAVQDNLSSPGSNKAAIRFFHLAPDAPLIDVGSVSGSTFTKIFSARSFESATTAATNASFVSVDPGSYTFQVKVNGAGTTLLTATAQNLEAGKIYTFYLSGISGSGTTPLSFNSITNN